MPQKAVFVLNFLFLVLFFTELVFHVKWSKWINFVTSSHTHKYTLHAYVSEYLFVGFDGGNNPRNESNAQTLVVFMRFNMDGAWEVFNGIADVKLTEFRKWFSYILRKIFVRITSCFYECIEWGRIRYMYIFVMFAITTLQQQQQQ